MKEIFKYIEGKEDKLVDMVKEFVSIPTVNPPGDNYEKMVDAIEKRCMRLGLKTRRVTVPERELIKQGSMGGSRRINLLAEWQTGAKRWLHINGHYDVVPATSSWSTDAFRPVIRSGRIYGRGTEDMKSGIACTLAAIESLKKANVKPRFNIQLSFTPDEETGGRTGFGYLVRQGMIKADYGIGEGYRNDHICYGNKGILWFMIEVKGVSCHGSQPYKGINAFEKMLGVGSELMKLKKKVERRATVFNTMERRDRHASFVMGGELYGGSKTNIVPDRAAFSIDRRILPEEDKDEARKEILDVIEKLKKKDKDLKVDVRITSNEHAAASDPESVLFKSFSKAVKKVLGKKASCALLAGATDMRFLIRKGIPCAGYSPDGDHTCHGDDEYVKIKSLVSTTKIYADVMANLK